MALYVHLVKITPQGASKIREGSSSYETVRKFGESLGCKPLNETTVENLRVRQLIPSHALAQDTR
jgi:uncharacterized protein with GYD domain